MTDPRPNHRAHDASDRPERALRRPLALTRLGMAAERLARAFWPAWSVALVLLAALMLGAHEALASEAVWALGAAGGLALLAALAWGARRFRVPRPAEARERLDATLPGRPIAALGDRDAVGGHDPASRAIWAAHQSRMARIARRARAVPGDLRLADRDPFALRYVALTAAMVALLFGSLLRAASVTDALPGAGPGAAMASGPAWEGWIEPPAYTGRPSLYLADQGPGAIEVPVGSRLTVQLYGAPGTLSVEETVSGPSDPVADPSAAAQSAPQSVTEARRSFAVARSGRLAVEGPGGGAWLLTAIPDAIPAVEAAGEPERSPLGETRLAFRASDDHGVTGGTATIALDLPAVDRRHGLTTEPEPREPVVVDLPLPITGDRSEFEEVLIADLAQHPFAGLPVTITLGVADAASQASEPAALSAELPGRAFFDPLARAVIEQRRDLLWSRENAARVSQLLRAISNRPEDAFDQDEAFLRLRLALRRLEAGAEAADGAGLAEEARDEVAAMLWDVAVLIEDGVLADALERMRQAQERLAEAMREGATQEEIAELMQELREATREYMRELAQRGEDPGDQDFAQGETQTVTQDQLQAMMDRIQELMEQGRMEEAQELLEQLQEMMENMQSVEMQPGEGGEPMPGEQSMEDLQETLRDQQELSDDAFRDLQEGQGQPGQQQAQPGQQGQQPGQQGQQPGQRGQQPGQQGQQQGQGQGQERADGQGGQAEARSPPTGARSPTVSRRCATSWSASAGACRPTARRRASGRPRRSTAPRAPWTTPRTPCATATSPGRSTTRPTPWRPCARGCAPWASSSRASRRTSPASRASRPATPRPRRATRWAARPARAGASAPTRSCCRARTCTAAPRTSWRSCAAAPPTARAPRTSASTTTACSTASRSGRAERPPRPDGPPRPRPRGRSLVLWAGGDRFAARFGRFLAGPTPEGFRPRYGVRTDCR